MEEKGGFGQGKALKRGSVIGICSCMDSNCRDQSIFNIFGRIDVGKLQKKTNIWAASHAYRFAISMVNRFWHNIKVVYEDQHKPLPDYSSNNMKFVEVKTWLERSESWCTRMSNCPRPLLKARVRRPEDLTSKKSKMSVLTGNQKQLISGTYL